MSSTPLDLLTAGFLAVVREHGLERACADANWLQSILADYSPETPALNRVAALAAREGVPGWLQSVAPGAVDHAVMRAVTRLNSVHAIDAGAAHDAVSAWARALGVTYAGTRPTSTPVQPAAQPQDRIQRRIENLLNDAEAAESAQQWQVALDAYDDVLLLEPKHAEAMALRAVVQRRMGIVQPAAKPRPVARPAPPAPSNANPAAKPVVQLAQPQRPAATSPKPVAPAALDWREEWMSACGADGFGRWVAVNIAGIEHRFRYCAPGKFKMGSPARERGRWDREGPLHDVTLTKGFWLGEAPVTQRQWAAVAGSNPSHIKGDDRPVEKVSWRQCEVWMAQASASAGGLVLRFPTEAEWEYACRAGTTGVTYRGGDDASTLNAIAWYRNNSGGMTHVVKQKAPNAWGLYDMLGNVWEWCADSQRVYSASGVVDPSGGAGRGRVCRGGSAGNDERLARPAYRFALILGSRTSDLSFRLALGP